MARFKADQAENYKNSGTGGAFFSLKDDKDYASVRLMYNDMNDVECFSVHQVEVNGDTKWVNCNREYDEPLDNCPLCKAGNKLQVKMWVPLFLTDTQEVKVWERGRTFLAKLDTASRRYTPLCSNIFEIERQGKKGDQQTTYELMHIDKDDVKLSELPEIPQVLGNFVYDLTSEQMNEYLATGQLPMNNSGTTTPPSRNPVSDRRPRTEQTEPIQRRQVRTRATQDEPRTDVF